MAGYGNCDGSSDNGCEASFSSDARNCGSCGTVCPPVPNGSGGCTAGLCGLGSCWIGSYGSGYEAMARRVLGVPDDKRLLSLISLGYAAEGGGTSRMEMSRLVCYERYQ